LFSKLKRIFATFSKRERLAALVALVVLAVTGIARLASAIEENSSLIPIAGGTYVEGIIGQPTIVNPVLSGNQPDQDIAALVFSPLSSLLASLDVDQTGRTYTMKLKEGLTWDDGVPLTSDDIVFTVHTIQDPGARSPLERSWQGIQAERESELQVRFTLPTPFSFFPQTIGRLAPIPRHIFGAIPIENLRLSSFTLEPVGNGPYRFNRMTTRKDGFITRYELVPNEHYNADPPFIQTFTFAFFEREEDLRTAFRLREVQGFGSLLPESGAVATLAPTVIETLPMPRLYGVFFNALNNPALADRDLREALSLSIDRERIVREVFGGQANAIQSPIFFDLVERAETATGSISLLMGGSAPAATSAATSTAPSTVSSTTLTQSTSTIPAVALAYDPEAARAHLDRVDDRDVKLTVIVPNVDFLKQIADIVKDSWNAVGLSNVEVIALEPDDVARDILKTRNYELLLFGNVLQDPADLFPFWHSSQRFSPGLNLSLYQNQKADTAMESIRQASDPKSRKENLLRLDTQLTNDTPAVFLTSVPYFYTHTERLKGFTAGSGETSMVVAPNDRFRNVAHWYVSEARVLD